MASPYMVASRTLELDQRAERRRCRRPGASNCIEPESCSRCSPSSERDISAPEDGRCTRGRWPALAASGAEDAPPESRVSAPDPRRLETLSQMYLDLSPKLKKIIRGRGRRLSTARLSPEDLEEVVQEAFCRALRAMAIRHYDDTRELLPYLTSISLHVLADVTRARWKERNRLASIGAEAVYAPATSNDMEEEGTFAEVCVLVNGWLAEQPPDIRALCHRRFWLGESQRAAAESLRLSRQQVRTLEQRMRSSLSAYLRRTSRHAVNLDFDGAWLG